MSKFVSKYIAMFSLKLKRVIKVPITWILIVMRNQLSFFLNNYLLLEKRLATSVLHIKPSLNPQKCLRWFCVSNIVIICKYVSIVTHVQSSLWLPRDCTTVGKLRDESTWEGILKKEGIYSTSSNDLIIERVNSVTSRDCTSLIWWWSVHLQQLDDSYIKSFLDDVIIWPCSFDLEKGYFIWKVVN